MSDFLFSRKQQRAGRLAGLLQSIYAEGEAPEVFEFHGEWGSLAATRNTYAGFDPVADETGITVVVGGPVLNFASNDFLSGTYGNAGTAKVVVRLRAGEMVWHKDLAGPFVMIEVDKSTNSVAVTTDLLGFIPAYRSSDGDDLVVGTQVDTVAEAASRCRIDSVSVADFTFHGCVTYPYSMYEGVCQLAPATSVRWHLGRLEFAEYWLPREQGPKVSLNVAAMELRAALRRYLERVTQSMDTAAVLLSGGEDSRLILGMLPERLKIDALTYLQEMNREGVIAKRCAEGFGANFMPTFRPPSFHPDNVWPVSRLIGAGWEPKHARASGKKMMSDTAEKYGAVFGGLLSDSFLKGNAIKSIRLLPFLPAVKRPFVRADREVSERFFVDEVCAAVRERRLAHFEFVKQFRPHSAMEWMSLWPIGMLPLMAGFHASRRLFRNYEPFMIPEVVKMAAATPQSWKCNRDLFHRMAQPLLRPVKWLPHEDGRLPYFSPWNVIMHGASWLASRRERNAAKKNARHTSSAPFDGSAAWAAVLGNDAADLKACSYEFGILPYDNPFKVWRGKYRLRLRLATALRKKNAKELVAAQ